MLDDLDLLTTEQAAEILGVNGSRVRQLLRSGTLKGSRFGRVWAVREEDLRAYMATRRKAGRPRKES
jgi:excisionase family DNA binding protein